MTPTDRHLNCCLFGWWVTRGRLDDMQPAIRVAVIYQSGEQREGKRRRVNHHILLNDHCNDHVCY